MFSNFAPIVFDCIQAQIQKDTIQKPADADTGETTLVQRGCRKVQKREGSIR